MRTIIYFLLLATLTGCGGFTPTDYTLYGNDQLRVMTEQFVVDMHARGVEPSLSRLMVIIQPTPPGGHTWLGLCHRATHGYFTLDHGLVTYTDKLVMIDEMHWLQHSEQSVTETVYHELGHCTLGLEHVDYDMLIDGTSYGMPNPWNVSASLMAKYNIALRGDAYNSMVHDYWSYYLDQLAAMSKAK